MDFPSVPPTEMQKCNSETRASFLGVPKSVRREIYIFAGARRPCPIDLNLERYDRARFSRHCDFRYKKTHHRCLFRRRRAWPSILGDGNYRVECVCEKVPYSLLFTCRKVSLEVMRVLYSENQFVVCEGNYSGLWPLCGLTSTPLSSLTTLTVYLNRCMRLSRHSLSSIGKKDCVGRTRNCQCGYRSPLGRFHTQTNSTIANWEATCKHLARFITPSRLHLTLICDTSDPAVARHVLHHLQLLRPLASCTIRLSKTYDKRLGSLAKKGSRAACLLPNVFPSSSLPLEIQYRVLQYTTLSRELPITFEPMRGCTTSQFCCGRCSPSLAFCCCPQLSASYSETCKCWVFPGPLFALNHATRRFALEIFGSENHFIVDHPSYYLNSVAPAPFLGLLDMLQRLPLGTCRYIRKLTFSMPDFSPVRMTALYGNWDLEWRATARFIRKMLVASNLTLTLDLSGLRGVNYSKYCRSRENERNVRECRFLYQRLVAPIAEHVQGMKDFFVHLSWPEDSIERELREEMLERMVCGKDYVARDRGKYFVLAEAWEWPPGSEVHWDDGRFAST